MSRLEKGFSGFHLTSNVSIVLGLQCHEHNASSTRNSGVANVVVLSRPPCSRYRTRNDDATAYRADMNGESGVPENDETHQLEVID